jgi:hypothetical protein
LVEGTHGGGEVWNERELVDGRVDEKREATTKKIKERRLPF